MTDTERSDAQSLISTLPHVTADFVRDQWKKGQEDLRAELMHMEVNSSFISGDQWVTFNEATSRAEHLTPDVDTGEPLLLPVNRMRPALRRQVAKLTASPLRLVVKPRGASSTDIDGARIASTVVNSTARSHGWDDLREYVAWTAPKSGTAVLCTEWDQSMGDEVADKMGNTFNLGDTCESALTLAEVAFEPGTRDAEKSWWWIKGQGMPPMEAQRRYNLPTPPKGSVTVEASPMRRAMRATSSGRVESALTLVLTYYERPSSLRPEGAMAVVIDNSVVAEGPWPFPFTDRLNVAVVRHMPSDGRWTGETAFSDAVPLQRALNMGVSAQVELARKLGTAKVMLSEQDRGVIDTWDDDPAAPLVVADMHQQRPAYLEPPQIPAWLGQMRDELRAEIDDGVGDFDVARGRSSGSVTSGSGLALLAEQGDSPLSLFAQSIAQAFGRLGTMVLEVYADRVKIPQQALVYRSDDLPPETQKWTGEDFAGQTVCEVDRESVLPRSAFASFQLASDLKQMFPEMVTIERFAELARYAQQDELMTIVDPDVAKARRENHAIATLVEDAGIPVPARFDHHATHVREHNLWRKSEAYERLDPRQQAVVDLHVQAHEQLAREEAMQQMMLAMTNPALAGAAQAGEPPLPDQLLAGVPNMIAPEGGVGPEPEAPRDEDGNAVVQGGSE